MKLLLIADAHANAVALNTLDDIVGDVDLTVFAGDFLDWGFYPNETMAWFRQRKHIAVLGNHDEGLIGIFRSPSFHLPAVAPSFIEYTLGKLTPEHFAHLTQYPTAVSFEADGVLYHMSHTFGTDLHELPQVHAAELFETIWNQAGLPYAPQRRILFDHSHLRSCYDVGEGRLFLNPGSLSYRKGADHVHYGGEYMLIENTIVSMGHFDYPTEDIHRRLEASHFTEEVKAASRRCFAPVKKINR